MINDLLIFKDLQECSEYEFSFSGVTFLRDFGPWKKGETVENLTIRLEGIPEIIEFDNEGTRLRSCKYTLTPFP